jgi:glycine hydroxymethyltransferase
MTTREMGTVESVQIADWIADILTHPEDADLRTKVRAEVHNLCHRFPIYPELGAA